MTTKTFSKKKKCYFIDVFHRAGCETQPMRTIIHSSLLIVNAIYRNVFSHITALLN